MGNDVATKTDKDVDVDVQDVTVSETDKDSNTKDGDVVVTKDGTDVNPKDDDVKEIMIPKTRFDEVNQKYKEVSQKAEDFKEMKNQIEEQLNNLKKEKEGSQTAVTETTEKLETQEQKYQSLLNSVYEEKLKIVPEDMKDLVPEGLSKEDRISWITKADEKGMFKVEKPKSVVVGQPLNHSANQSQAEKYKKMNPLQLMASYYGIGK